MSRDLTQGFLFPVLLDATEFDDVLGGILFYEETKEKIAREMKAAITASQHTMGTDLSKQCSRFTWWTHRIMNVAMCGLSVGIIMFPLDVMLLFFHRTDCFSFSLTYWIVLVVGLSFAAMDKSLHGPSPSWTTIIIELIINPFFLGVMFCVSVIITFKLYFGVNAQGTLGIYFSPLV